MTGCKVYLFNHSVSDIVLGAGADHTIQVFDMNQGCMATQIPDAHCRAVHHLTQNKSDLFTTQPGSYALESYNLFLSSAVTDGLKLWDLRTARCVRHYGSHVNRYHHCTAVLLPCGRFIATGSEDHIVSLLYIYDTRSSNFLHKLPRHSETVLNVAFNPANPEYCCCRHVVKMGVCLCFV
uniref:WD repeat domain 27 n=1 Tax=Sinocyclocheilus grahami TaxID=75366 RepID=A0A672KP34_SINGR